MLEVVEYEPAILSETTTFFMVRGLGLVLLIHVRMKSVGIRREKMDN